MEEQDNVHRMAMNLKKVERLMAAEKLGSEFPHLNDKEQAWKDLIELAKVENSSDRWIAIGALGSAFPHLNDKEQAWKDLIALAKVEKRDLRWIAIGLVGLDQRQATSKDMILPAKDEERYLRGSAAEALSLAFPHLNDKEQATKDLIELAKDKERDVRVTAAKALGSAFPHLTDKEQATENLIALAKDKEFVVRWMAVAALGSAFPHLTDKDQATKELIALAKDKEYYLRLEVARSLSSIARHYMNKKDFKKTSQCFSGAASAHRSGLFGLIMPEIMFYLYEGLGYYYHGRSLVKELPEKRRPTEYINNLKNAVSFYDKSINYMNKFGRSEYENEMRFISINFNIFSALYEYNLAYFNFDKKRFVNIKNYLDTASAQCKITDIQQGEEMVRTLEKLTSSLRIRLEEFEQDKEKLEAVEKGKGGGWEASYKIYINIQDKEFKESLLEIDSILNELEEPLFKKIAAIEKKKLEELLSTKPKTSWQRLHEIIKEFIKKFWKIIAAIGLILATVAEIIKNWQSIIEFFKNFLN